MRAFIGEEQLEATAELDLEAQRRRHHGLRDVRVYVDRGVDEARFDPLSALARMKFTR